MEGRQIVELALQSGRKRQSSQTGLVHHSYESYSAVHDTIPLYENACFVLALFRTRLSDNVIEGKAILEKILSFQKEGNFPIYLHDYPVCRSLNFGLHFLPVFFVIRKEFSNILGENLRGLLHRALESLVAHGNKHRAELSWSALIKLQGFLQDDSFIETTPSSSYDFSEYLLASQMLPSFSKAFEKACSHWNQELGVYVGLETSPKQEKMAPKSSLYDFFMAESTQMYPKRLLQDHIVALQSILVMPYPFVQETKPGQEISNDSFWQKYFGDQTALHAFTFDAGHCLMTKEVTGNEMELVFEYPEKEMQEGESEIAFFINRHDDTSIWVGERKATLFYLYDSVFIKTKNHTVELQFFPADKNRFAGHISYDNRKSQVSAKGELRFEAYDYKISLRSIRRDPFEKVRVKVLFSTFPVLSEA